MEISSLVLPIVIIVLIALGLFAIGKQYRKVGPNEVLIVSGGLKRTVVEPDGTKKKIGYRTHVGGGTFVLPLIERAEVLPLEVFTVQVKTSEVLTSEGIPIGIDGTSQVRVKTDEHSIRIAAELFLGRGIDGMKEIAHQIIEGHVRSTIGRMSAEDIYRKRTEFADMVEEATQKDFDRLGLSIISFSITNISDPQGYLEAIGRPKIAKARHDAEVAEAESAKEAAIKSAEARKEGDIARLRAEIEVAEATRDYEAKRAQYQAAVNQERARADAAYELERQKLAQTLKKQEAEALLLAKKMAIEIEEMEIKRKEKELEATVRKPAEAESFRAEMQAKGKAVAMKLEGTAEAEVAKAKALAEAEAMKKKAESWREYNQAAIYQMVIDVLPEIAKAIAEPLSKIEKIVIVGSGDSSLGPSKITGEIAKVIAQLPTIVESVGGKELKDLLSNLRGQAAQTKQGESEKQD